MTQTNTLTLDSNLLSEDILKHIAENVLDEFYLISYALNSLRLTESSKHQIIDEILHAGLDSKLLKDSDFKSILERLKQNLIEHITFMGYVKKTEFISSVSKQEILGRLLLNKVDHDAMLHLPEENLETSLLREYDDVIGLYTDLPLLDEPQGNEIRIQLHVIKNSRLPFADPERKAELLEELLLQEATGAFQEFLIIHSLYNSVQAT